jgi:hypothetical protein
MQAAAEQALACTLGSDALGHRLAWIRRVTERSLLDHRLDGTRLRLTYHRDALANLESIVAQERVCCSFLRFSLEPDVDAVRLTIDAPDGLGADARWLFDQFLPRARVTPTRACGCASGACG